MSELRDRAWDDELRALADVREGYRAAVRHDTPPEALDAAILAASRRAVGAGPRAAGPGGFPRWRAPLAAAAVIVLSATVAWWRLDDGSGGQPPLSSPTAVPGALPERTRVADGAADIDPARAGSGPAAGIAREEGSRAILPAESGSAPTEAAVLSKPRTDLALAQPKSRDSRVAEIPTERDTAPADALATHRIPSDEAARAGGVAAQPRENRQSAEPVAPDSTPAPAVQDDLARASAAPAASASGAAPAGHTEIAATSPGTAPAQPRPREAGESAEERPQPRALPAARALTRAPTAADRTMAAPAPAAAAPRIGGNDDGVAELREILGLWEAGRRDEASLALGRLRCSKPHVPIPPDLPVPSPKPLRCPAGDPPAKEALPGDR